MTKMCKNYNKQNPRSPTVKSCKANLRLHIFSGKFTASYSCQVTVVNSSQQNSGKTSGKRAETSRNSMTS